MDKASLTQEAIQKTAEALREEAVKRLNACVAPTSNPIDFIPPKSPMLWHQSKRNEALITSVVLTAVVGLSTWIQPIEWRLAVGCLCAGIAMSLGGLLERKGHIDFGVIIFLAAMGLFVWLAAKFGAMGAMIWAQSLPLMGIGAFGFIYIFYDKFDFKERDFAGRSEVR